MRIRHHHGGHHHHGHHHKGKHHRGKHHKGKKGGGSKALTRTLLSQGMTHMSQADTQFAELVRKVSDALLTAGWMASVVDAIEQVIDSKMASAPGKLVPATVSNLTDGVQAADGTNPTQVMAFVNGSSVATPVYVPPHLVADVAAGQEIWVHPVNGHKQDLALHSIRNFNTAPASSGYETSAHASSTYETQAHASSTYETQAAVAGHLFYFLASPFNVANAQAITFGNSATWTVAGGATGVPSNAVAVLLYISYSSASTGGYLSVNQGSTSNSTSPYLQAGDIMNAANAHKAHFIMPLGGNTTITGRASGAGNGTVNTIMILGYIA